MPKELKLLRPMGVMEQIEASEFLLNELKKDVTLRRQYDRACIDYEGISSTTDGRQAWKKVDELQDRLERAIEELIGCEVEVQS